MRNTQILFYDIKELLFSLEFCHIQKNTSQLINKFPETFMFCSAKLTLDQLDKKIDCFLKCTFERL